MENLFDYATKELSQDAFLCWLFSSFEDEGYGHIGKELIAEFVNMYPDCNIKLEQITNIVTHSQAEDIDIVVDFKVNDKDYILAIEDKTSSSHHDNQLVRYKDIIDGWNKKRKDDKDRPTFLIYYKTHRMDEWEKEEVKNAEWMNYSFERINAFWNKYTSCGNMIIEQYAKHIVESYKKSTNESFPEKDDIDEWIGYFSKLKKDLNISCDSWIGSYRSLYAYFCLRPKDRGVDNIPYLEIRSRDCVGRKLNARILLYGVKLADEEKKKYKEAIGKTNLFYSENNKEQIGSMLKRKQKPEPFKTVKEYEDAVKAVIEKYLSIFEQV